MNAVVETKRCQSFTSRLTFGRVNVAKLLLENGADVNAATDEKITHFRM